MTGTAEGAYQRVSVAGESFVAFIPAPLPPKRQIDLWPLSRKLDQANQALGRLDALARLISTPAFFIYQYVRKEAVLSSQIEGTQSSLAEFLRSTSSRRIGSESFHSAGQRTRRCACTNCCSSVPT